MIAAGVPVVPGEDTGRPDGCGDRCRSRSVRSAESSWADYDAKLISKGGGIFARAAKEVALSEEMKSLTGLLKDKATPQELIRALLTAHVDLLLFGGIGTFIKASTQANVDVGDRANDALRVNGRDIRASVVGEGANLGVTQLGRIEYRARAARTAKAGASIPMRSTIPPASIRPTTRSTSRS